MYPAGKVAVVLSQPLDEEGAEAEGDRVQSFMQEHTDEITALAVSPCGKWVATGEAGAHPKVSHGTSFPLQVMCVWRLHSALSTMHFGRSSLPWWVCHLLASCSRPSGGCRKIPLSFCLGI